MKKILIGFSAILAVIFLSLLIVLYISMNKLEKTAKKRPGNKNGQEQIIPKVRQDSLNQMILQLKETKEFFSQDTKIVAEVDKMLSVAEGLEKIRDECRQDKSGEKCGNFKKDLDDFGERYQMFMEAANYKAAENPKLLEIRLKELAGLEKVLNKARSSADAKQLLEEIEAMKREARTLKKALEKSQEGSEERNISRSEVIMFSSEYENLLEACQIFLETGQLPKNFRKIVYQREAHVAPRSFFVKIAKISTLYGGLLIFLFGCSIYVWQKIIMTF